jgi:peptidoglycan/LPS O-acetylase OafA/YrhL
LKAIRSRKEIRVMRKLLPLIAVVWGGAVVVYGISKGLSSSGSYAGGQVAALLFGVALVFVGVRSLTKRSGNSY